jgi:hypothetical protein
MVAVLATGALVLYRPVREPIARMSLKDGTELRLEYVTYGTDHRIPGASRFKAWLSRQAQRWPKLGIPVHASEYQLIEYQLHESEANRRERLMKPELIFWFTRLDPNTGKFLADVNPPGMHLEPVAPGLLPPDANSPFSRYWFNSQFRPADPPTPNTSYYCSVFDRRTAEIQFQVTTDEGAAFFSIPNPTAKIPFPVWQPEPLPQTRRVGDLEFVLRALAIAKQSEPSRSNMRSSPGDFVVSSEIQVSYRGQKVKGVEFFGGWVISDATGNIGDELRPPPLTETAWKIRTQFYRSGDFPFDPTDGLVFPPVDMPETGKAELLAIPDAEAKDGFYLAALLGPGRHILRGREVLYSGAPISAEEFEELREKVKIPNMVMINSAQPTLVLLRKLDPERRTGPARILSDGQSYGLNGVRWHGDARKADVSIYFPEGDFTPFEVYGWDGKETPPPSPGTSVTVQIAPYQEMESVEFLVAPPKLPPQ